MSHSPEVVETPGLSWQRHNHRHDLFCQLPVREVRGTPWLKVRWRKRNSWWIIGSEVSLPFYFELEMLLPHFLMSFSFCLRLFFKTKNYYLKGLHSRLLKFALVQFSYPWLTKRYIFYSPSCLNQYKFYTPEAQTPLNQRLLKFRVLNFTVIKYRPVNFTRLNLDM